MVLKQDIITIIIIDIIIAIMNIVIAVCSKSGMQGMPGRKWLWSRGQSAMMIIIKITVGNHHQRILHICYCFYGLDNQTNS